MTTIHDIVGDRLKSFASKELVQCANVDRGQIRLEYIFDDGKPRRSGYSTVAQTESASPSTIVIQP